MGDQANPLLHRSPRLSDRYRPINGMNNTARQNARMKAGLGDLHVHDLRHTVGMRLREAGVPESTIADILRHSRQSMTLHYSVAQVVEIHAALEKIKDDTGRWNKSLAMLRREQEGRNGMRVPQKSLGKEKQPGNLRFRAVVLDPKIWCGWQESNPRPLGS